MIRKTAVLVMLLNGTMVFGQEPETVLQAGDTAIVFSDSRPELFTELSDLNPKKAAFLSAVLPGMGQVYNRQYWKLPFVIGGGVAIGHYIRYQDRLYRSFRSAWLAENDIYSNTNSAFGTLSNETLERNAEKLRRDRDYLMIIGALFYLLQIADAHISAHLYEFQINQELSMNVSPAIQPTALISRSLGLSISLNFK